MNDMMYDYCCCHKPMNARQAVLSSPELQIVQSEDYLDLGEVVIGGQGPYIIYKNDRLFLKRGIYLVSYSTSAVWLTTPYGTNEAIIGLVFDGNELPESVSTGEVPPQETEVGEVPYKINLSKTIVINASSNCSELKLLNKSIAVMDYEETTLTIVRLN